jgi:DNA-binding transcriptional regulator WhiA
LCEIAALFGVTEPAVYKWLKKYGIDTRRKRYPKNPFNGSLELKAYLIGFVFGDFSVRKHRRQIQVITATSHPAQIELFSNLFSPYTATSAYPHYDRRNHRFRWVIYCYLDPSFEFLLFAKREKMVPSWILEHDGYFYSFLAGLFDAEGSIVLAKHRRRVRRILHISSRNLALIRVLISKLKNLGYHPHLSRTKGKIMGLYVAKKEDVLRLILAVPIKHSEKTRKRELLLTTKKANNWYEVEDKVAALKMEIEREVRACTRKAREEYSRRVRW